MNLKLNLKLLAVLALCTLLTSGCLPEQEPGNVTTTPTPTPTPLAPDAPLDAPVNEAKPVAMQVPAPPPPPGTIEPGEGVTILLLEVETVERVEGQILPTIRRVSLDIHGLDDEGKPALVNGEPILIYSEIVSTPSFPIISIGPGIPMINIKVALYGKRGDAVLVTVAKYGQPLAVQAFGAIEPARGENGIVIMNIPVVIQ